MSLPRMLLSLALTTSACTPTTGEAPEERVVLQPDAPAAAPVTTPVPPARAPDVALRPMRAAESAAAPAEPGAIPSRPVGPSTRCRRLADDSGWTCSPAAATAEELARLVAEAESATEDAAHVEVFEVLHPAPAISPPTAFLKLGDGGEFGSLQTFVALESPGGWGFAADAGEQVYGVNGSGDAALVEARRDPATGLLVVEARWTGDDAACTEELSWHGTETRATVCEVARLSCRTVSTLRTTIETRGRGDGTFTTRHTADGFRARLELRPSGALHLRPITGRLPRAHRILGRRAVPLAGVPTHLEPFQL